MAYLTWLSDEDLKGAVEKLIQIGQVAQKKSLIGFHKNVIDPFSAMFQIAGFGMDYKSWTLSEQSRQSQKTLQNHIGEFHQRVLASVTGWENLKTGNIMDLLSSEKGILAEIKNKHNTVKGGNLSNLYKSMESQIMPKSSRYKGYTAYYVTIIPKKPGRFDLPFTPSDKETGKRLPENPKIRIIDGASFYDMVTGEDDSLKQLFDCLPQVIAACSSTKFSGSDINNLQFFFTSAYGF